MKSSKVSYLEIGVGVALLVSAAVYTWLYQRFPVYNERQVTAVIERHVPVGTSQVEVVKFLKTLKKRDVYYEASTTGVGAYFPQTMFYMRGWYCSAAYFTFKNGKMTKYEVKSVTI